MLNMIQDEKDCREIGRIQDEITNIGRAISRAMKRNDLSYIDTLKSELSIREKRLEKLRRFSHA